MSNPIDPTEPAAAATPGTDLEKKARGDVDVTTKPGTTDEPKSNRTRNVLIALGVVVVLAVAAGVTFAVLAPQAGSQDDAGVTPTDAATTAPGTGTGTGEEAPVDPDAPSAITACTTDNAKAAFGTPVDEGGIINVPIVFTNSGDQNRFGEQVACTLEGFPDVQFITLSNGTAIGAPAVHDAGSTATPITLEVDGTATATLKIAGALAADCNPLQADGFRVSFPGATDSFVIESSDYMACQNPERELLTVGALTAG